MNGGVATESTNGVTSEYRDDNATCLPITLNEASVTGLEIVARRPAR